MGRSDLVFPYPDDDFLDDELPKGVLSPSGFNTYRRCPRQFMYAYLLGQIRPPGIAMIKGTAIHKGAEVIHKNTIENKTLMPLEKVEQNVSDTFDEEITETEGIDKNEAGLAKDKAIHNIVVYYHTAVPLIKPIAAEKPFAIRVGSVPFRGVIDLVDTMDDDFTLTEDNEPKPQIEVVTDLKTSTKLWVEQKIECEPQLTFYALAENTLAVRVDFLLDQKRGIRYVPKRAIRRKHIKDILIEDAEDVASNIKKGIFPRCDPTSWVCTDRFCGYYYDCIGPK